MTTKAASWKCSNCDSPCVVTATFNGVKPFPPCVCSYWLKTATWVRVKGAKETCGPTIGKCISELTTAKMCLREAVPQIERAYATIKNVQRLLTELQQKELGHE